MKNLSKTTKFFIHLLLGLLAFGVIKEVWATTGGLDSSGCHHAGKSGYHCHPQKMVPRAQATREQCKTMPNDGWCTKYQKKPKKAAQG